MLRRKFFLIICLLLFTSVNTFAIHSTPSSLNRFEKEYIQTYFKEGKISLVADYMSVNKGLSTATICAINIQKLDSAFLVSEIEIRSKVISEEPSSDARGWANNEIEIYFLVNGMIICTITDFGEGFSHSQGSIFYVSSSIAEKKYEAKFLDNNVIITKTIFFDGNENIQWIRTYKSNWILTNCEGDC